MPPNPNALLNRLARCLEVRIVVYFKYPDGTPLPAGSWGDRKEPSHSD